MSQLQRKNAVVYGISADTVESHKGFAAKEHLNFPLLADPGKEVIGTYGVLNPAGYADRVTYIIGPDGRVAGIDRSVNAAFYKDNGQLLSRHGLQLALQLSDWHARVGGPVPNFSLTDTAGDLVNPMQPGKKGAVVLFLSTRCPASRAYDSRIHELTTNPEYADLTFIGVDPDSNESTAELEGLKTKEAFDFPLARDPGDRLAGHFQTRVTPTAWVINPAGEIVYAGAIDNGVKPGQATKPYLKDALDALLAGKPAPVAHTTPFGCGVVKGK